ncbi:MAG TPA: TIGR02266 family protein [Labilithrix sp.]|nr:TIGR02266 family protein [Labilithrix sp.]
MTEPTPPSLPRHASPDARREGERALAGLASKLAAIPDAAVVRPSTDPHGAAATALLVADYLGQPPLAAKLAAAKTSPAEVLELRSLARAIIGVVTGLGGDYLSDAAGIPGDLVQRGQGVRTTIAAALERALPDDPELLLWLEAIRLGSGVVDLVYDLRTLADLCTHYGHSPAVVSATAGAAQTALSAADALEFALRAGDSPESAKARTTLARLWTLFVPAYERAASAARTLSAGEGRERQFPALALVASHRRARRRPLSLLPSSAPRRSAAPPKSRAPSVRPSGTLAQVLSIPASPALPDFGDVELIEADDVEEVVEVVRSNPPAPAAPPPAPASGDREDWSDTRRASRHTVEIEVGIASESNFYLGFTENLSSGGVFVATYATKPLGSHVAIALAFPNGEELRVPGVVRWLRDATTDGWPGMGVQFESLSPEDEAKVRKFLSLREPMFYDE